MRVFGIVVLALAGLALTSVGAQQLYKWVDKDGKITYSDQPPPKDAKNVEQKKMVDSGSAASDDVPYSVKTAIDKNPVTLFANFCGEPCDGARSLLNTRGVPFTDRNPEKDPKAMDALKTATGGTDVPVLMVGTKILRGFSEETWQEALTTGGYPKTNPNLKPRAPTPAATPPAEAPKAPATPR
jgi:glutaredoxin